MKSFEILIEDHTFRIIRNNHDHNAFSVFNHATCHIIKKNHSGIWEAVEHRFGTDYLPLDKIGDAIDKHYQQLQVISGSTPSSGSVNNC